uniref:Uncharacterized protein n=1 Tax=Fusarium oxysporum (strain Fo5176) TaxID=660025 RepID=A0A0D2XJV2_FUSOF
MSQRRISSHSRFAPLDLTGTLSRTAQLFIRHAKSIIYDERHQTVLSMPDMTARRRCSRMVPRLQNI